MVMDEQNMGYAQEYKPTFKERFWKRLGFHYDQTEFPENDEEKSYKGWMLTYSYFEFSFRDRLRLLLTGRLKVKLRQLTDVEVIKCKSTVSFKILYPGEKNEN
jgi:hypothetical protein